MEKELREEEGSNREEGGVMDGEGANEELRRVPKIKAGEGGFKSIRERGNGWRRRRRNGGKRTDNTGGGFKSIWERQLIDGEGAKVRRRAQIDQRGRGVIMEEHGATVRM